MSQLRISVLVLAATAALGAGCGGETTDISQGVDRLNSELLEPQGVTMDCPDEVDGGEGATFDCTMKATKGDASAPVTMKIVKEEGDLAVDIDDEKQFDAALTKVAQ